jgi:site-specific DNA recombinase
MRAIIYTRVSSEEQVSNLSLDVQEKTCREYCARNGWTVVTVYREEGESAKTADRTELRRMLAALRTRPVDFVVVYDTSRFARDVYVHTSLKQLLMKAGAQLRAATQPLEDTAAGRAIEGVFAVFNQLDNELRAEKIEAGMKETVARGRWPWKAPIGYRNDRSPDGRKIVVPDEQARLVRKAFESVAAGDAPAAVLRRVTALGLTTKKGRPVRLQEFRPMLRNPFYRGIVRSTHWGIETQGQHEGLVDPATWAQVQVQLSGRPAAPGTLKRTKEHPEFPLRSFVRCAACGRPLTASLSRGKMGRRYGYYRCWNKECGAIQMRSERLEEIFGELLRRVQLAPGMVRLVEAALLDLWQELRRGSVQEAAAVKRRMTELEERKKRLVRAYIYDQAIDRATYDEELAGLEEALTFTHLELRDAAMEDFDMEASLGYARAIMTKTYQLWEAADPDQKRRLQKLIFPEGVSFDGEALRTPVTALIFSTLRPETIDREGLVAHTGFEPVLPA